MFLYQLFRILCRVKPRLVRGCGNLRFFRGCQVEGNHYGLLRVNLVHCSIGLVFLPWGVRHTKTTLQTGTLDAKVYWA